MPRVNPGRFGHDWTDSDDLPTTEPLRRSSLSRPDPGQTIRRSRGRSDGRESFKCRHCRTFVGPTISGGRHRNHCPICLYSRHVDDRTPGDRASGCRSLMAPIGVFHRRKGEQVILHRCLGCGVERHCRVAADDHPLSLMRLEPVEPRTGAAAAPGEREEAAG